MTCTAKTASGFVVSNKPSSSMSLAPKLSPLDGLTRLEPSSAGWKINITVPGRSSFNPASTSAVAISMAVSASCPQACMTETVLPKYSAVSWDAKGSPSGSLTGRASMSARRATVRPTFPPFQDADDACTHHIRADVQPQAAQVSRDKGRSPHLLVAELWVLVDVLPPCDQFLFDGRSPLPDFSLERDTVRAPARATDMHSDTINAKYADDRA